MFCPQCGSQQSNEVRFCKSCGANLQAVLQAAATRDPDEKFDWGKTWVAEMFLSEAERKRREEEVERQRGITPEIKRYNEIKAGVITGSVGLGAIIFLFVFMQGIILSGNVPPGDAQILSRIWVAGIVPLLIGLAIIFNGLFIGKKIVNLIKSETPTGPGAMPPGAEPRSLRPADTSEFIPSNYSVTEDSTRHLVNAPRKPPAPNNS